MQQQTSKRNPAILALAQAYDQNNVALISRIEGILLPDEVALPDELQAIYDSWGNNPIEEPELAEAIKEGTILKVKRMILKGKDIDAFEALEVSHLARLVIKKVTWMIDDDGKYKVTPNTMNAKLPKTSQVDFLIEFSKENLKDAALKPKILEMAGLDVGVLTEWESELIMSIYVEYVKAVQSDTIASATDRTPFARYLKN